MLVTLAGCWLALVVLGTYQFPTPKSTPPVNSHYKFIRGMLWAVWLTGWGCEVGLGMAVGCPGLLKKELLRSWLGVLPPLSLTFR